MSCLQSFLLLLELGKPKAWTKAESTKLLIEIHVKHHSPNHQAWGRTREDIESHYQDIYAFTFEQLCKKQPGFNLIHSFYRGKAVEASLMVQANASTAAQQQWTKEKTVALFDEVGEKGSCGSDEEHFRHFYDVVGTIYRMQSQDRSLEGGIRRAVDEFHQAGCPKVSLTGQRASPQSQGSTCISPVDNDISRAAGCHADPHDKPKQS